MSFNIMSKTLQETAVLHLIDPASGEEMYADEEQTQPLEIELFGRSSKVHRTWAAAAVRKQESEKNSKKRKTLEEQTADNAEFFALMTKAIRNIDMDGKLLTTKEDFKAFYSLPELGWILDQVAEKLGSVESFLQK
jgi:hypothetical protein